MSDDSHKSSQENTEANSQDQLLTESIKELKQDIKEKNKAEENLFTSIENMAKAVGAVAGAIVASGFFFYILGYVFVSNYYASFGYRVFDLNRPAYLAAGIVFVLALIIPIVVPIVIGVLINRYLPITNMVRFPLVFVLFFTVIYLFLEYFILLFLTNGGYNILFSYQDDSFLYVGSHLFIAWFIFYLFTLLRDKFGAIMTFAMYLLMLVTMAIIVLKGWGTEIYPNIIPAFAGGETTDVQLVIVTKDADIRQFTGIGIQVFDLVTEDLTLLDQGDDFITVITKSCKAVRLSKALIAGILYSPPPKDSPSTQKGCVLK